MAPYHVPGGTGWTKPSSANCGIGAKQIYNNTLPRADLCYVLRVRAHANLSQKSTITLTFSFPYILASSYIAI